MSNIIEEELVKTEVFLSIALNKRLYELKPSDYNIELPIKLKNDETKLKNCSQGVWKFNGKNRALLKKNKQLCKFIRL